MKGPVVRKLCKRGNRETDPWRWMDLLYASYVRGETEKQTPEDEWTCCTQVMWERKQKNRLLKMNGPVVCTLCEVWNREIDPWRWMDLLYASYVRGETEKQTPEDEWTCCMQDMWGGKQRNRHLKMNGPVVRRLCEGGKRETDPWRWMDLLYASYVRGETEKQTPEDEWTCCMQVMWGRKQRNRPLKMNGPVLRRLCEGGNRETDPWRWMDLLYAGYVRGETEKQTPEDEWTCCMQVMWGGKQRNRPLKMNGPVVRRLCEGENRETDPWRWMDLLYAGYVREETEKQTPEDEWPCCVQVMWRGKQRNRPLKMNGPVVRRVMWGGKQRNRPLKMNGPVVCKLCEGGNRETDPWRWMDLLYAGYVREETEKQTPEDEWPCCVQVMWRGKQRNRPLKMNGPVVRKLCEGGNRETDPWRWMDLLYAGYVRGETEKQTPEDEWTCLTQVMWGGNRETDPWRWMALSYASYVRGETEKQTPCFTQVMWGGKQRNRPLKMNGPVVCRLCEGGNRETDPWRWMTLLCGGYVRGKQRNRPLKMNGPVVCAGYVRGETEKQTPEDEWTCCTQVMWGGKQRNRPLKMNGPVVCRLCEGGNRKTDPWRWMALLYASYVRGKREK